jgi:LacI family transcriptional regulator
MESSMEPNGNGKSSIRIKDIAKLVGVSVGTVDRVIHNRGEVSKESYQKVMAALETTGYKPNLIARTLGSNKTYRVAALIPNPEQDEYWKKSADGVQLSLEEWGQYGVMIEPHYFNLYNKESFTTVADRLLESEIDGILIAPIFYQEALQFSERCTQKNIPFVLFNNTIPEAQALTFVGQNLYESGRVGAELLHTGQHAGTFAILHIYDDIHNSLHLYEKEKGFNDYFLEQGPSFTVVSLGVSTPNENEINEKIQNLLREPELRGILVTTSKGASTVSNLLNKESKKGIRLVAYDLLQRNIDDLQKGMIDFIINQDAKRQAFLGISKLVNYLLFKKELPAAHLFPLEIITRQNLNSYQQLM